MKFVTPKVYFIGETQIILDELTKYLVNTGQEKFLQDMETAWDEGLSSSETLCSFYAKLCYKSLVEGKNANISKTRAIADNLKATINVAHGSIWEHAQLNFVITNCSRVFTHELVRHRVGTAFSQTSGRYCRLDEIEFVTDPILESIEAEVKEIVSYIEQAYRIVSKRMLNNVEDFETKKKLTSALRRIAPNGQANEIGFSVNIRSLRHLIQVRTSRHAEWEIRNIFNQIYELTNERFPLLYYGAKKQEIGGLLEISGMKLQPYEIT